MLAWNHWYHITLTAYGQWLPGDSRGWRVRDYKYHVLGNYKNPPPPSKFATNLHAHAESLLKNDPIVLPAELRSTIGERILDSIRIQKVEMQCLAVAPSHVHALIRSPDDRPKVIAGKCKQNVTRNVLCRFISGWWAADSHAKPIRDQSHFSETTAYILEHASEGAWTWCREVL